MTSASSADSSDAERNAEPGREAVIVPQQRRHIGADAHEGAVAERDEAEAAHQRPGGVDEGPEQDLDQQMQEIGRA